MTGIAVRSQAAQALGDVGKNKENMVVPVCDEAIRQWITAKDENWLSIYDDVLMRLGPSLCWATEGRGNEWDEWRRRLRPLTNYYLALGLEQSSRVEDARRLYEAVLEQAPNLKPAAERLNNLASILPDSH